MSNYTFAGFAKTTKIFLKKHLCANSTRRVGDLYKLRSLKSLGSRLRFLYLAGLAMLVLSVAAQTHAQQPAIASTAPPTITATTGVYVQTHRDPITGREIDTYLEQETVPVLRWEQQEVIERRYVPQWVNETQKTTEVQYVPVVTYQTQARNLNAWNPLLPQRLAYEYIPVTQYQTVNRVVDKPITYQKYTDQEFKVVIPKLVQATEQRAKYTHRERIPQPGQAGVLQQQSALSVEQLSAQQALVNRNAFSSSYVMRPTQELTVYPGGNGTYPYSPYVAVASPRFMPTTQNGALNNYMPAAYPMASVPVANYTAATGYQPNYTPVRYQQAIANAPYQPYPTTPQYMGSPNSTMNYGQSWWQLPNWMKGNGLLLNQNLVGPSSYASYPTNNPLSVQGYAQGYTPAAYPTNSYAANMQPQTPTIGTVRPTTAPTLPNSNYYYGQRDSMQAGLPPSVLR